MLSLIKYKDLGNRIATALCLITQFSRNALTEKKCACLNEDWGNGEWYLFPSVQHKKYDTTQIYLEALVGKCLPHLF